MCSHAKSALLEHFTQSPYFHFIPTAKKHNFLVAVFPMNGNYAVCAPISARQIGSSNRVLVMCSDLLCCFFLPSKA
jgi:hypothetical protein